MKLLQNKTNVDAPSGAYPFGKLRDNPGDNSGTPVNEDLMNDVMQLMEKIMNVSGVVANGLPENQTNGFQLLDALKIASRGYYVYSALISQAGTAAPTGLILENTLPIGTIVWGRVAQGIYSATLTGQFLAAKTFTYFQADLKTFGGLKRFSDDVIVLNTSDSAAAEQDGLLTNNALEIRVYL